MLQYTFVSSQVATPYDLHALWATISNKLDVFQVRFAQNGRIVHLITDFQVPHQNVTLPENNFRFLKVEEVANHSFENGQLVNLIGKVDYARHDSSAKRNYCPINHHNNIERTEREFFINRLTNALGVDVKFAVETNQTTFFKLAAQDGKVWIGNAFEFDITASIIDATVVNSLASVAIFRRKSYGFGAVEVTGLE